MNNSAISSAAMMPDSTPLKTNGMRSHTHLSIPFEKRSADAYDDSDRPIPSPCTVDSVKKTSSGSARKSDKKHRERYSHREYDAKQKALDPTGELSNSLSSLTLPFSDNHVDKGDDSKHIHTKKKSRRRSKRPSKPAKDASQLSQAAEMNDSHKSMNSSSSSLDWRRLRDDTYKPEQTKASYKDKAKDNSTVQDNHEFSKETELEPSSIVLAANSFDNSRTSNRSDTTPNVSNTDVTTDARPVVISVPPDVVQPSLATTTTTTTTTTSSPTQQIQQVRRVQQGLSNSGAAKSQLQRRYSNPATMTAQDPGFVTLPEALTVILPSGPLGVAFKNQNNTTVVWSMKEDSPVLLQMKVGMVVDTLTLPADGIELRGLDSAELCKAINNSTNMEGRFLLLKSPFSTRLPKLATSKVVLPPEGDADDLGLVIVGDPATLKEVATTSPLHGKAVAGQQILALGLGDGTAYLKLRSFELQDFLQETSGIQGRFLVLRNLKQRSSPSNAASAASAPSPAKVVNERPGFLKALSQRWGSSRSLLGMDDSSRGSVRRRSFGGYSVNNDRLSISSHDRLAGSTRRALEERRYSNTELVATGFVTYPKSLSVVLPTGKLGVVFQNQNDTTVVLCMKEDSPLLIDLVAGMVVDTLTLPGGNELRGLCTSELCKALNCTTEFEGRTLLLKSPHSLDLPAIATTKIMLHDLCDGRDMGLNVEGYPAVVSEIASTSPLVGMVLPGQQILSIGLTSGAEYNMPTCSDVHSLLQNNPNDAPRVVLLKNLTQRTQKLQMSESSCDVVTHACQVSSHTSRARFSNQKMAGTSIDSECLEPSSSIEANGNISILYKKLVIPVHQSRREENRQEPGDATFSESDKKRRKSGKKKKSSRRSKSLESPKLLGCESVKLLSSGSKSVILPASNFTHPKSFIADLPTGHLGVVFQDRNDTTVVLCMKVDSLMPINLVPGIVVDTLTLPGGNELRGLCTSELCNALKSTTEFEGRTLLLKCPHSLDLPAVATTKIMLHDLRDGRDLGLKVERYPAAVSEIASTSPLVGMVLPGQQILSIGLTSGAEYNMPTCSEVQSLLQNAPNDAPSFLLLKNLTQRTQNVQLRASSCGVVTQGSQRFRRVVARRWSSSGIDKTIDDGYGTSRRLDSSSNYRVGVRLSIGKTADFTENSEGLEPSSGIEADGNNSILYKNLVIPFHQRNHEQVDMTIDDRENKRRKSGKKKKSSRRSKSLESPKRLGSESVTHPAPTIGVLVDSSRASKQRRSIRHRDVPDVSSTVATSSSQASQAKPVLVVGVGLDIVDESEQSNASRTQMTLNSSLTSLSVNTVE